MDSQNRFFQYFDRILLTVSAVMLAFIATITLVQVFYRYVLNDALSWSAELTRIGFIWMTFIGSAVSINRRRHLRIDAFLTFFSEKVKTWIDFFVHIIVILFMAFLTLQSFELGMKALNTVTGAMRLPRSVFFFPVTIGAFFMLFFSLRIIVEDIITLISGSSNSSKKHTKGNHSEERRKHRGEIL